MSDKLKSGVNRALSSFTRMEKEIRRDFIRNFEQIQRVVTRKVWKESGLADQFLERYDLAEFEKFAEFYMRFLPIALETYGKDSSTEDMFHRNIAAYLKERVQARQPEATNTQPSPSQEPPQG